MRRQISALEEQEFDLAIIGGGITGACLAFDAAQRGMSVALIEKDDFGAATSSASSKLLHGGIRNLQQGRPGKVRESALERVYFQTLAPHLTRYVPFVIPTYRDFRKGKTLLKTAMLVYQTICMGQDAHISDPAKKVPKGRLITRHELQEYIPSLQSDSLTGGVLFFESHMHSSERMTLAFLVSATHLGAEVANYVRAESFLSDGKRIRGIKAVDTLTGETLHLRANIVVNAAGPWIPSLNRKAAQTRVAGIVTGYFKGAHIVTPPLTQGHAVALPTMKANQALVNRGGRHVFVIPWRGHSLIGTTYRPCQRDLDEIGPDETDIKELVQDINSALGQEVLRRSDVLHSFAGIYPLIDDFINPGVYQGTGDYQIVDHEHEDGIAGLVSVFGAKYTTARLLAEKALDRIGSKLDRHYAPCRTRHSPLHSGDIADIEAFRRDKVKRYQALVSGEILSNLVTNYGTEIDDLMALVIQNPELAEPITADSEVIAAQLAYAVDKEMACHLDDFVFRRTGLGTLGDPGDQAITRCAELMGRLLGWSQAQRNQELQRTWGKFLCRRDMTYSVRHVTN